MRQRVAPRIPDASESRASPHERARCEWAQVERREVEGGLGLRVRVEEHLEPAVDAEAVDEVGRDAAADRRRPFEDEDRDAARGERTSRGEAGKTTTDDDDIRGVRHRRGI